MRTLAIIAASLFLIGVTTPLSAEPFSFQYQKILETSRPPKLILTNYLGRVVITGQDTTGVVIDAVKRIKAGTKQEASDIADRIEIKVEQTGDQISVTTNYLSIRDQSASFWRKLIGGNDEAYGSVEYVVRVPMNCDIRVDNGYGGVVVQGIQGKVDLRSGEGGATVDQIKGTVTIRNSAGEVNLGSIEGSVDVATNAELTRGELLFGPVTVRQPSGTIDLQWVQGDVRIKCSSAQVNVRQESGSLDLSTSTGSIAVQTNLQSEKDFLVQTESGDISLTVPDGSSGSLDIRSQAGNIRSDVPVTIKAMSKRQLKGNFGAGGVKISLVSTSGDVTVAQF